MVNFYLLFFFLISLILQGIAKESTMEIQIISQNSPDRRYLRWLNEKVPRNNVLEQLDEYCINETTLLTNNKESKNSPLIEYKEENNFYEYLSPPPLNSEFITSNNELLQKIDHNTVDGIQDKKKDLFISHYKIIERKTDLFIQLKQRRGDLLKNVQVENRYNLMKDIQNNQEIIKHIQSINPLFIKDMVFTISVIDLSFSNQNGILPLNQFPEYIIIKCGFSFCNTHLLLREIENSQYLTDLIKVLERKVVINYNIPLSISGNFGFEKYRTQYTELHLLSNYYLCILQQRFDNTLNQRPILFTGVFTRQQQIISTSFIASINTRSNINNHLMVSQNIHLYPSSANLDIEISHRQYTDPHLQSNYYLYILYQWFVIQEWVYGISGLSIYSQHSQNRNLSYKQGLILFSPTNDIQNYQFLKQIRNEK